MKVMYLLFQKSIFVFEICDLFVAIYRLRLKFAYQGAQTKYLRWRNRQLRGKLAALRCSHNPSSEEGA